MDFIAEFSVEYRGHTFPGYNKPIDSWIAGKKKAVLAKKGDIVKLLHFGDSSMSDYTKHKDKKRKANYLARSGGIKDKDGNLTKDNILSKNFWARSILWGRLKKDKKD
jgi:hypothetical protein